MKVLKYVHQKSLRQIELLGDLTCAQRLLTAGGLLGQYGQGDQGVVGFSGQAEAHGSHRRVQLIISTKTVLILPSSGK